MVSVNASARPQMHSHSYIMSRSHFIGVILGGGGDGGGGTGERAAMPFDCV